MANTPTIPDASVFAHIEGLEDIPARNGPGKGLLTMNSINAQRSCVIKHNNVILDAGRGSPFYGLLAETILVQQNPKLAGHADFCERVKLLNGQQQFHEPVRKIKDRSDDLNEIINILKPHVAMTMSLGMSRGWADKSEKSSRSPVRFIDQLATLKDTSLLDHYLSAFDDQPKAFLVMANQPVYPREDRMLLKACLYDQVNFSRLTEVLSVLKKHVPDAVPIILEKSPGLIEMINAHGQTSKKPDHYHLNNATRFFLDSLAPDDLAGVLCSQFLIDGRKGKFGTCLVFDWLGQIDPEYLTQVLKRISPEQAKIIFEKYSTTITARNRTADEVLLNIDASLKQLFGDDEETKAKLLGCVSMDASFEQANCEILKPLERFDMLCHLKREEFNQLSPAMQKAIIVFGRENIFDGAFKNQSKIDDEIYKLLGEELIEDPQKQLPDPSDLEGWFALYHVMRREILLLSGVHGGVLEEAGLANTLKYKPFVDHFRELLKQTKGDWKTIAFKEHEGRKPDQPLDLQSISPYFARQASAMIDDVTRYVVLPYLAQHHTLAERRDIHEDSIKNIYDETRQRLFEVLFTEHKAPLNRILALSKAWQERGYNLREFPSDKVWASPFVDELGKPIHSIDLTSEDIDPPPGEDLDGLFVVPLLSSDMLKEEGRVLQHCVGQDNVRFIKECQNATSHIVSIRRQLPNGSVQHLSTLNFSIEKDEYGDHDTLHFCGHEGPKTEDGRSIIQPFNMDRIENKVWLWLKEQVNTGNLRLAPKERLGTIERLAPSALDEEYGFFNDYSTPENAKRSEINRQIRFDIISGHQGHVIEPADVSHLMGAADNQIPEHHAPLRAEPTRAPAFNVHPSRKGNAWKLMNAHYSGKHPDKFILDHGLLDSAMGYVPRDEGRQEEIVEALKQRAKQRQQLDIRAVEPRGVNRILQAPSATDHSSALGTDDTGQGEGSARG